MQDVNDTILDVPFYSQSWDLTRWQEEGYESEEDMRYWQASSCGVLCLQMAIEYFTHKKLATHQLIQEGLNSKAYTDQHGWIHGGLVELARSHGLRGEAQAMSTEHIGQAIKRGDLVVVSIRWGFQGPRTLKEWLMFWKRRGGHLAVVTGARWRGNRLLGFYVHHTSKRPPYDWRARFIPARRFTWGYTGRAILLQKVNNK